MKERLNVCEHLRAWVLDIIEQATDDRDILEACHLYRKAIGCDDVANGTKKKTVLNENKD